ncbi:hypothetical protein D3C75_958600 [compost metagenome]
MKGAQALVRIGLQRRLDPQHQRGGLHRFTQQRQFFQGLARAQHLDAQLVIAHQHTGTQQLQFVCMTRAVCQQHARTLARVHLQSQ